MHCQSLLDENNGQISTGDSNTECMQIEFEFQKKFENSDFSWTFLLVITVVDYEMKYVVYSAADFND